MAARITSAEAELIWRDYPPRLTTSYGRESRSQAHVLVRLRDEDGRTGYGEASPLPSFTGETGESIVLQLRETFLPLVVGQDPFDVHAVHERLEILPQNTSAKCAIDLALHDLMGRAAGLPVTALLGGRVRERAPVTVALGIESIERTVADAVAAVQRGVGTVKLKVGGDADTDVQRVRAVRDAVGPRARIRVDANQGYEVPSAIRVLSRIADADIELVEQPVAAWDLAGMAAVRRAVGVPVMADESLHTLRDAQRLIELDAADIFAVKLIKTSGLTQARAITLLAAAHRIGVVVISPYETEIGCAASLALALAAPTGGRANDLGVFDRHGGLADTQIRSEGGAIVPGDEPGLGVRSIPEMAGLGWEASPSGAPAR